MPAKAQPVHDGQITEPKLPYGKHAILDEDLKAVVEVLESDWLTTGPKIEEFEQAFASYIGTKYAVAVSSGTAALHASLHALGIGVGDEVILSPITFIASANVILYQRGTPVFADIDPDTLLVNVEEIKNKITERTKAIIAVDYAGQPCAYEALEALAAEHKLALVSDACHALGGSYHGRSVGTLGELTTFSFHPVKHITTGEGGMVVTDNQHYAERMKSFRNHGIDIDVRARVAANSYGYEMQELGYNYRITDFQCALGISQLKRLSGIIERRRYLAALYRSALSDIPGVSLLAVRPGVEHAYHLFVVRLDSTFINRDQVFVKLREKNIGVNVHYRPVYLHKYYQDQLGFKAGLCPQAEAAFEEILTLPLFPEMTEGDVMHVVEALKLSSG